VTEVGDHRTAHRARESAPTLDANSGLSLQSLFSDGSVTDRGYFVAFSNRSHEDLQENQWDRALGLGRGLTIEGIP